MQRVPLRFRTSRERFVGGHRVTLLRDGREAFPAMLAAIDSAKRQVLLEMYWFGSDRIGRRFAMALTAAVRRGVEVAVIYDALGSIEASSEMFERLRDGGVHVVEFNPVMPWRKAFRMERLSRRDHRKILVVDGRVGFTGGINIADHWLPTEEGGQGWRDDMVAVEGPAVAGLVQCFMVTWQAESDVRLQVMPAMGPPMVGDEPKVRVLGEAGHKNRREIVRAYLYNIHWAKERVWIANSYFVPARVITRALIRAARRGVDVRILVPGQSDVRLVQIASRGSYDPLLSAGARIFEWHGNVLHSKTAVVDGRWSTIGTFNLDHLSLRNNLEVNVGVLDDAFGAVMEASFRRDLEAAVEVTPDQRRARPLVARTLESAVYRLRKLL